MNDGIPCLLCGGWISKTDDSLTIHDPECPVINDEKPQNENEDE